MKTKSKQRLKSAVSILLMLAVVITGAFAYFTATDSKKNVFTIGNVDIVLHEDDWTEPDANGDSQHIDGDNINVLPGDKISKAPYIENTGDNNAWVYMTIGIPTIQRDTSRADDLAISFTNTNIPVEAYALQEGYGNVDGSQAMWDAYFADKSDDKFGTAVTDESALLNRVELFNLPDIDSGWTHLGEVFKSEDGFNYYVFAYNDVIEPTSNTTPVIEWVQLNPALTQNEDVLFSPETTVINYYSKTDIGESEAKEIYNSKPVANVASTFALMVRNTPTEPVFEYSGSIESDYEPKENDVYFVSNANALLSFNEAASEWEVSETENYTVDKDLIPKTILNKNTVVYSYDPNDPAPDLTAVDGTTYNDGAYFYKYNYYYDYWAGTWTYDANQNGWGVIAIKATTTIPSAMASIGRKPVVNMTYCYADCTSLVTAPEIPESITNLSNAFYNCYALETPSNIPESAINITNMFNNCINLREAPEIPSHITNWYGLFGGCLELTEVPEIPYGVTDLSMAFASTGITSSPKIPETVKYMNSTFVASLIEIAPEIPESVISMNSTFENCDFLTGTVRIPSSVTSMKYCFGSPYDNNENRITMEYYSSCTAAASCAVPSNVSKICIG